jgi:streptomycin 6-kinase
MMELPADFVQNIKDVFGEEGEQFLKDLPKLIDEFSGKWGLSEIESVSNLSFNFVTFARRGNEDVVLKLGVPRDELVSEMTALKLYNGNGACGLLKHDEQRGALLLERLKPGRMLSELEDDDERTHIAADVMMKLWRDPLESGSLLPSSQQHTPSGQLAAGLHKFIKLSDWFAALKRIRPHFNGGIGPFPKKPLEQVEALLPELLVAPDVKLMHGDFHHFNILSSDRGWLVIDPKGVIGPAGYEVGPFMINPWGKIADNGQFKAQAARRVSIFCEKLGWEREKIIHWATAHAVLSAWWNIEDGGKDEYSLQCARLFSELK